MRLTPIVAAVVSVGIFAGCQPEREPSQPPTSEPALTTTSPAPATQTEQPTTEAPTTEAAATTAEPEPTSEAPVVAMDQTEEGAVAFVEYYIEILSQIHTMDRPVNDMRELSLDSCRSCEGMAAAADKRRFGHDYVRFIDAGKTTLIAEEAIVEVELEQVKDGEVGGTVWTLAWEEGAWFVSEIQLPAP